jgi:hypothetical protein
MKHETDVPENNGGKTGWPPGLLQDDNSRLSRWFASKPDARRIVRENIAAMKEQNTQPPPEMTR